MVDFSADALLNDLHSLGLGRGTCIRVIILNLPNLSTDANRSECTRRMLSQQGMYCGPIDIGYMVVVPETVRTANGTEGGSAGSALAVERVPEYYYWGPATHDREGAG